MNRLKQRGRLFVARPAEDVPVMKRKIKISLLEREGKPGHVIHRTLHVGHRLPKKPIDRQLAKPDSIGRHAVEIPLRMPLLFNECVQ